MTNFHPFHIVNNSPWPIINSFNLMNLLLNSIFHFSFHNNLTFFMLMTNFVIMIYSLMVWWRDITREGCFQGHHTWFVNFGLKISMILFITSEIMFFFSFFWSFFHFSLAPEMEISNIWPPKNIITFNPYHMPLLNTIILLISGITVTWCHHSLLNNNFESSLKSLSMTIMLGLMFSYFQSLEYMYSEFNMNDSSFGSIFFMSTGFHGIHVLIGTLFLSVNLLRLNLSHLNNTHHFSFEAAAWYWHFVDVVWIYLYTFVYWWFW